MGSGGARHWVLIETGANQAYIFNTNRLRHVVGASYLVREVGVTWVPEAAQAAGAQVVLAISGKSLLLTEDAVTGRAIISQVSERALREAPGLEVTGVVGPGFDPASGWRPGMGQPAADESAYTHVEALAATYEALAAARVARPSQRLRDPMLPWSEVCRDSGLPAAGVEQVPDGGYAAAPVLAKSGVRGPARDRMRVVLADLPDLVPGNFDDLASEGWIAVIHADGNGVGEVFTGFAERALRAARASGGATSLSLDEHARLLTCFASELELATETALGVAARDAATGQDAAGAILPVVVGGDDVTIACRARFALPLVRAFVRAFEEQTARMPTVRAVTGAGLTAAAGIAYVKPHHPFSVAYGLAEELTASAKLARQLGDRKLSAVDLYVAFESTLADLATLRGRMAAGGLARHGGPYVIPPDGSPPAGVRDIAELDRAVRTVSALSASLVHDLREGLARGTKQYQLRLRGAEQSDLPAGVSRDDIRHLAPAGASEDNGPPAGTVIRLLDALLLEAISRPPAASAPGDAESTASAVPA